MHRVADQLGVSQSTVSFWVARVNGVRLDRADFSSSKPGAVRGWNRLAESLEDHIAQLRRSLREESVLGEYGAWAIQAALQAEMSSGVPSVATINRCLSRQGLQDGTGRIRRPAPPPGWYLPQVVAGEADIDCFDFIEGLKIDQGPLVEVLTAKSLHGKLCDSWVMTQRNAQRTVQCLRERWKRDGLPHYAQFDNDTLFQGAHQFADTVGRVSRLCLQLGVIPVFAPPREHGMQNTIESFNALWQAKVWGRHHVRSVRELQALSHQYNAARRARTARAAEAAPTRRPMPQHFRLNLNAPLHGTMIFIRRTDNAGRVNMLAQHFTVSKNWPHRLVRCEVDFDHHCIRCFALRRRAPDDQPLLTTIPYHRPDKPFRGKS